MHLVLTHQMSRGFILLAQRLRRLIAKLASGFNTLWEAVDDGKRLMVKHQDLIRRGDLW